MAVYTEEDERDAHVENMRADTHYKQTLGYWEGWKVLIAAIAATALIVGAGAGSLGYLVGKTPPAPIVIQLNK